MKQLRWTTTKEWVDKNTGEILTEKEVKEHYIITKTIRNARREKYYEQLPNGGYIQRERGVIKVTNECTREGKQIRLL